MNKNQSDLIKNSLIKFLKNNIAQTSLMATVTKVNDNGSINVNAKISNNPEHGEMSIDAIPVLKLANIEPEIKVGDVGLCLIEYDLQSRNYLYHNLIYLGKVENMIKPEVTSTADNIKIKNLHTAVTKLLKSLQTESQIPNTARVVADINRELIKLEP